MALGKTTIPRIIQRTALLHMLSMSSSSSFPTTTTTATAAYQPPASLRGVFVGSGSDGMSDPRIATVILELAVANQQQQQQQGKQVPTTTKPKPNVLYVGTATYDLPQFATRQTQCFVDQGCHVTRLELVHNAPSPADLAATMDAADVIVVGGGNTLYAVDRWHTLGSVVPLLQAAMERGAVLTGGSAGAICWFDGGHSDSMDPDSYYPAMQTKFGSKTTTAATAVEESSAAPDQQKPPPKDWKYIRVPGLGFLPGLMCPHHDRIQSNGLLRAHDLDHMLLQHHAGEVGIGIDHWAALVVDGNDSYRVVSLDGKPGSVLRREEDGSVSFSPDSQGVPGVWIKHVVDGRVVSTLLPPTGKLSEVLRPATEIFEDHEALEQCRRDNPDQGPLVSK